jgi:hypothetical protein
VKRQQDTPPPFIQSLLDSGTLVEVTKFSKFLSACAILHYGQPHLPKATIWASYRLPLSITLSFTGMVQTLPHWMDDPAIVALLPAAADSSKQLPGRASHAFPASSSGAAKTSNVD